MPKKESSKDVDEETAVPEEEELVKVRVRNFHTTSAGIINSARTASWKEVRQRKSTATLFPLILSLVSSHDLVGRVGVRARDHRQRSRAEEAGASSFKLLSSKGAVICLSLNSSGRLDS